jgi:hypothetical protein
MSFQPQPQPAAYDPSSAYAQQPQQQQQQQQMNPQYMQQPDFIQSAAAQVMMNPQAWQSIGNQFVGAGQNYVQQNVRGLMALIAHLCMFMIIVGWLDRLAAVEGLLECEQ